MDYTQNAIKAALEGRWKEAIDVNLSALKDNPKDLDSLNRLGRAYMETGQKTKALETYEKVLKMDKFNSIAIKNTTLIKNTKFSRDKAVVRNGYRTPMFLEEPGITKTVSLVRLGDVQQLSRLQPAHMVKIVSRQHNVCVLTQENDYIGRLPDDLASRMREFLKSGNTYSAWIRSIELPTTKKQITNVKIFIREETRSTQYRYTPSFPLTEKLSYAAFTPPELIHEEKPDVSATEEQEESGVYGSSGTNSGDRNGKEFSTEN
jgi:tetratricopeptide (TPR) repeat protein